MKWPERELVGIPLVGEHMTNEKTEGYELRLERLLDAPRANVWRCWTERKLLEQWFAPPSWATEVKILESRPGGASHIVMRGPDGKESDGVAVILEAVPKQRLEALARTL